ncbi:hypothetical protein ACI3K5_23880 [Streptomyces sp. MPA0124]|uniref:hypothetical protein n=1 Tax=Streptomyces sp. MPA0124 TaxID=3378069 RepID=UPI0038551A8C
MTDQTTPLRDRIAAAVRTIQLRLGPNAVAMAQRGEPIILNLNEADDLADAVLAVLPATTNHDTDTSVYASRAAEAELYVLLRKAGEPRNEAQALIDRHRDEVLHRAELRRVADETAATETDAEPTAEEIARDHVTTLHLIGEQLSTIEGWFWEHLADVREAEQPAAGARQDGAQP